MSELFQGKYRTGTLRLPDWDYGSCGAYFITICTKSRIPWFGHIDHGKMHLSEIGKIADACWMEIPQHFPFVALGEYIVMPDHVHGIVVIVEAQNLTPGMDVKAQNLARGMDVKAQNLARGMDVKAQNLARGMDVKAQNLAPQQSPPPRNQFGPQSKNLASIIRGFKVGVTKQARLIQPGFMWQSRYYDRIIRNTRAYQDISAYIKNNPANYRGDPGLTI